MKRVGIAAIIALAIYGVAVGAGTLLYATGTIATGATQNNCANFKEQIAAERGIDAADVPQSEIKARAQTCLAGHELTAREAYHSEYVLWSIWPAVICAVIFLAWPVWARALTRQEQAELAADAGRLEMGQ